MLKPIQGAVAVCFECIPPDGQPKLTPAQGAEAGQALTDIMGIFELANLLFCISETMLHAERPDGSLLTDGPVSHALIRAISLWGERHGVDAARLDLREQAPIGTAKIFSRAASDQLAQAQPETTLH